MRKWMNLLGENMSEDVVAMQRPTTTISPEEELQEVRAELADLKARHDALIRNHRSPNFAQEKEAFIHDVSDKWTRLADREWELMQIIGDTSNRKNLREFFS